MDLLALFLVATTIGTLVRRERPLPRSIQFALCCVVAMGLMTHRFT